jgi:hypothetical protein
MDEEEIGLFLDGHLNGYDGRIIDTSDYLL